MNSLNFMPLRFLRSLSTTELDYVKANSFLTPYNKADIIFKCGEVAAGAYYIKKGEVRVFGTAGSGNRIHNNFRRGDFFGYTPLFFDNRQPFTAIAECPTVIIFTPEEIIIEILNRHPKMCQFMLSDFIKYHGGELKTKFNILSNNN